MKRLFQVSPFMFCIFLIFFQGSAILKINAMSRPLVSEKDELEKIGFIKQKYGGDTYLIRAMAHYPSYDDCSNRHAAYIGEIKGTTISGACRIDYPKGYFKGSIKPLDLLTVDLNGFDVYGRRVIHDFIPADKIEVIEGAFYNCKNQVLHKITNDKLSSFVLTEAFFVSGIQLWVYELAARKVSKDITAQTLLQPLVSRKLRIVSVESMVGDGVKIRTYPAPSNSDRKDLVKAYSELQHKKYKIVSEENSNIVLYPEETANTLTTADGVGNDVNVFDKILSEQKKMFPGPGKRSDYNALSSNVHKIPLQKFGDFDQFLLKRSTQMRLLNQYKNASGRTNSEIPVIERVSEKPYAYFGDVTIDLLSESESKIGSYQYVYDEKAANSIQDLYRDRSLKATVTNTKLISKYAVYCDGEKIKIVNNSSQSSNTSYEGGSPPGSFLFEMAQGYMSGLQIGKFEKKIIFDTQMNACYYRLAYKYRNDRVADSLFNEATRYFEQQDYVSAITLTDAAMEIEPKVKYHVMLGDIFSIFNQNSIAAYNYLTCLDHLSKSTVSKGEIYRKIALSISRITDAKELNVFGSVLYPEFSITYIKKAAIEGDKTAQTILQSKKEGVALLEEIRRTF